MIRRFYNGKLLLFGEYAIVHGATGLAVPSKFGQFFNFNPATSDNGFIWSYRDISGNKISVEFDSKLNVIRTESSSGNEGEEQKFSRHISEILRAANALNSSGTSLLYEHEIQCRLNYPAQWGLGSSSTLYAFLGDVFEISPYKLFFETSKGSGYDIACATADTPIHYSVLNRIPEISGTSISESIKDALVFVYLGKKQSSLSELNRVKDLIFDEGVKQTISSIAKKATQCSAVSGWCSLMDEHEQIISNLIQRTPVKEELFPDFAGSIKSLGAWGGDFIMAASTSLSVSEMRTYFNKRSLETVLPWNDILV